MTTITAVRGGVNTVIYNGPVCNGPVCNNNLANDRYIVDRLPDNVHPIFHSELRSQVADNMKCTGKVSRIMMAVAGVVGTIAIGAFLAFGSGWICAGIALGLVGGALIVLAGRHIYASRHGMPANTGEELLRGFINMLVAGVCTIVVFGVLLASREGSCDLAWRILECLFIVELTKACFKDHYEHTYTYYPPRNTYVNNTTHVYNTTVNHYNTTVNHYTIHIHKEDGVPLPPPAPSAPPPSSEDPDADVARLSANHSSQTSQETLRTSLPSAPPATAPYHQAFS